ncbi:MAG: permease-like cell division protein FtsX, partial [Hyphomicrobiaceae bacterium]|nr:permease-like cell division protein FtsX [Hyphomicrobiaceae bacterium]
MIDEMMANLGRRKGGNTIAVIIMGLSLLILVVFLMVTLNMARLIDKTSEEMRLFVYLEDDLDQVMTQDIQRKLLGFRGIEEVSFISKDEALIEFREMLGEESDLLDELV